MIQDVPKLFFEDAGFEPELFVYDFKMKDDAFKTKVNLSYHMFSFLQKGTKHVHLSDSSVVVNNEQAILVKKGNCLWSELLDNDEIYYCKLLFFSDKVLGSFLAKYLLKPSESVPCRPFFVVENDEYIDTYLRSLSAAYDYTLTCLENIRRLKFEELMLYLVDKYGEEYTQFLYSMLSVGIDTYNFKRIVNNYAYSCLKVNEIAFLCHMSLSTFKRTFIKAYGMSPGKWFHEKRLTKARDLIANGHRATDIYLEFGYSSLSGFSLAFKNHFGYSPNSVR